MTSKIATPHPLLGRKIVGIETWKDWLKRWEAVSTAEELMSLLHYGFDAGGNVYQDIHTKALFYLSIADGHSGRNGEYIGRRRDDKKESRWTDDRVLTCLRRPSPPHEQQYSSTDIRRMLAEKAWEMLCLKFLGGWVFDIGSMGNPGWFNYWGDNKEDLEVIRTLLVFYDPKEGANNFGSHDKHHRKLERQFLREFIKTAWEVVELEKYPGNAKQLGGIIPLCRESRPRLINMMLALQWEKMLLELPYDERTLPHLERHVAAWSRQQMRSGTTLETEASNGYKPAQIVLLLRNQIRQVRQQKKKEAA